MAITSRQNGSLSSIELPGENINATPDSNPLFGKNKKRDKLNVDSIFNLEPKKPGFLRSTISELSKVNWPNLGYVLRWSLVIIIFTTFFSLALSLTDNTFNSLVQFTTCTAPVSASGDGQSLQDCSKTLGERLIFRKENL